MRHSKSGDQRPKSNSRLNRVRARKDDGIKSPPQHRRKTTLNARIFETECGVFRRVCQTVNTPYALEMLGKLNSRDWLGIATSAMPDPESSTFDDDYLVYSILRKNPRMPTGIDRRDAAIQKFLETEVVCRETNDLLRQVSHDYATPHSASLAIKPSVLAKIRGIIRDILGPLDKKALEYVESRSRFGPGATFHCSSKNLTADKKLESAIGLTPSLYSFVGALEPHGWLASTSGYRLTAGSKATTVPKDALVDRFIAIEPSLNMFWQLGVGALIRRQLKRAGLDLKHQADRNRLRVRFAERTGLATIDLSSASDTVARLLVAYLLPKEWHHLLVLFRSPKMLVDGTWIPLEKFSSMGNGYTFELETLIFYAVSKAFDDDPYVFGDDIIVRQDVAHDVIRTLNVFGFSVNRKKTYLAGTFFESCGSDYWRGKNVRPFFFKKDDFHDYTSAVVRMANAVRRYASRRNNGYGCDSRFLPAWLYLLGRDPNARRTAIPEGYGDVGIIRDFDDATPSKLRNGHCGYFARVWTSNPLKKEVTGSFAGIHSRLMADGVAPKGVLQTTWDGRTVAHQYGATHTIKESGFQTDDLYPEMGLVQWGTGGPTASQSFCDVRGRNGKAKLRNMPTSGWRELGPWI